MEDFFPDGIFIGVIFRSFFEAFDGVIEYLFVHRITNQNRVLYNRVTNPTAASVETIISRLMGTNI